MPPAKGPLNSECKTQIALPLRPVKTAVRNSSATADTFLPQDLSPGNNSARGYSQIHSGQHSAPRLLPCFPLRALLIQPRGCVGRRIHRRVTRSEGKPRLEKCRMGSHCSNSHLRCPKIFFSASHRAYAAKIFPAGPTSYQSAPGCCIRHFGVS